ncbi:hypothetical protein C478_00125 [Natrinema thermotolerans DSM 11552]|nr:hypothetical protein C478_00125 [Natrinema thermotolerans DSM 11552]
MDPIELREAVPVLESSVYCNCGAGVTERGIVARPLSTPDAIRASIHAFNSAADADAARGTVAIRETGPAEVSRRPVVPRGRI